MKTIHNQAKNRFELYADNGTPIGQIEYMNSGTGEMYATHTEVFAGHEGQGHATRLLDTLADYAADNQRHIIPICGFVKKQFAQQPARYAAVIKE